MANTLIYDGIFLHANTSPGLQGTTSAIIDAAAVGTALVWKDQSGGYWKIHNNCASGTGSLNASYLTRPLSEGLGDYTIVAFTPKAGIIASETYSVIARWSFNETFARSNFYYLEARTDGNAGIYLLKCVNGVIQGLSSIHGYTTMALAKVAWPFVAADQYAVSLGVTGAGPVTLTVTVSDLTHSSNTPVTYTFVDTLLPLPSGIPGLDLNTTAHVSRVQIYHPADPNDPGDDDGDDDGDGDGEGNPCPEFRINWVVQ